MFKMLVTSFSEKKKKQKTKNTAAEILMDTSWNVCSAYYL